MQVGPIFHWSPRDRRPGILRRGLLPLQRATCTSDPDADEFRQPMVCLSSSPHTAWRYSGGIFGRTGQTWDLWQVRLVDDDALHTVPCWGSRVDEFRVANRIPKSRLWWVGERTL